jgi:putative transposase
LAGRVLLKIVYLLVRRIVSLAILVFRDDMAKDAELLVLRHENTVLRRRAGRIRYEPADRVWFAALAQLLPRRYGAGIFPVTPATLLAWHHKLAARKYGTSRRRKPGRPPTVRSIARLAVRKAEENPLWGYRRIHGELTKLGLAIAPSTVYEILRAAGIGPAPRLYRFITRCRRMSCDLAGSAGWGMIAVLVCPSAVSDHGPGTRLASAAGPEPGLDGRGDPGVAP